MPRKKEEENKHEKMLNVKRSVSFNFIKLLCFSLPLFQTTYKFVAIFLGKILSKSKLSTRFLRKEERGSNYFLWKLLSKFGIKIDSILKRPTTHTTEPQHPNILHIYHSPRVSGIIWPVKSQSFGTSLQKISHRSL